MSNFNFWKENIADMPSLIDGEWVDLETGLKFDPSFQYNVKKSEKKSLSEKSQAARNISKFFGAKALKGSARQKEWAEKIRAEKILSLSSDEATLVCSSLLLEHSKFWIEHRDKSASLFFEFIKNQKELKAKYDQAQSSKDAELVKEISKQYNDLTSKWGF